MIILTANDLELDEVKGLTLGADDYITKPFSLMVLRTRLEKALRTERKSKKTQYRFGPLFFDFSDMRYLNGEQEIILSRTEQKLLQLLVENEGNILTRERLTDRIWDGTEYLHTVYGQGYVWTV